MQGLPWKAALTARALGKKDALDRAFFSAWETVNSARGDVFARVPSLDGFRMIREMAFRAAPEVRHYYQEAKAAFFIGDAAWRIADERVRKVGKAEEALRELSLHRNDKGVLPKYVEQAFESTLSLLRALSGEEMLAASGEEPFIYLGGIMLEPTVPEEPAADGAVNADVQVLSRMMSENLPSLKANEIADLQKAIIAGQPMPGALQNRLRKSVFSRALKAAANSSPEAQREILSRLLEATQPSLGRDAGSLALKGGTLYKYANDKLAEQRARLKKEADELLPRTSPALLFSLNAGEEMRVILDAWQNMRRRAILLKELGVTLKPDKNWNTFWKC
ncbi:hypothetical protein FACS1894204_13740 [Synergistales bacterium]|nr:hypothetical protein FACS1894204_13740 [Synergistales bacterium]